MSSPVRTPETPYINPSADPSGEQRLEGGPHESEGEQDRRDVEEGVDLTRPALGELDQDVGDKAETYPVGDVEGQRQRQDRQESRYRLVVAVPQYESDGGHHQEANDYQGWRRDWGDEDLALLRPRHRHGAAENRDERRERQRDQEQQPHHHAGHTRPSALGHPRAALYEARHRAGARGPPERRRQGVDEEDALGLRYPALLVEQAALLADRDHGPHRVEEVGHKEREDHGYQRDLQDLRHGQHASADGRGVEAEVHDPARRRDDARDHADDSGDEDADQ